MKTTALTALVIANTCALVAGFLLTHLGFIYAPFAVPAFIVNAQLAAIVIGGAVALSRRNRRRADQECFPSSCA
jgi:ABC-type xylose transport system permease subunit